MKSPIQFNQPVRLAFMLLGSIFMIALNSAFGQTPNIAVQPAGAETDYVSIQVDGGTIQQVLNAFAIQTGRNVVIGPEVICDGVNIHLNRVRWDEALEVILKPYGFGYRKVGDTIVISKLEKLAELSAVEPLETKVFNLRFLDASDVQDMLAKQLSSRGTMSIMTVRGQKGWEFASRSGSGQGRSASSNLGKLARTATTATAVKDDQGKSKTLIVTDVPSSLARVSAMLTELDVMPQQVLVEARFVEVNDSFLRDIGVELSGNFDLASANLDFTDKFFDATPSAFNPASVDINAKRTLNTFGAINLSSSDVNALINLLQEDDDSKLLSAPRVLTMNNQEATIIIGEKFPIIESDVSGGSSFGDSGTRSTTLDYYENIGIQLNVVPQISGDEYINMIVHPSVSAIADFETGVVASGDSAQTLTRYPRINVREAETQIMLKNTETIVIGGLLEERKGTTELKVPFLGDIPLLGRLFRRDTDNTKNIDLLIFLSATIVNEKNYDTIIAKEGEATIEGVKPVVAPEIQPAAKEENESIIDEE